jgi:hypothetical protein
MAARNPRLAFGGVASDRPDGLIPRLPGALALTQTPKYHIIFDKRDGITAWHLTDVYWPGSGFSQRLSRAAASRALLRH